MTTAVSVPAFQVTDRTVRVVNETRRLRFRDHMIDGYLIQGQHVTVPGTWTTRDWEREEIAAWVQEYHRWQLLRWDWLRRLVGISKPTDFHVLVTNNMVFA